MDRRIWSGCRVRGLGWSPWLWFFEVRYGGQAHLCHEHCKRLSKKRSTLAVFHVDFFGSKIWIYPLVIKHGNGKSPVNGGLRKELINGPFSIAMLDYLRVYLLSEITLW